MMYHHDPDLILTITKQTSLSYRYRHSLKLFSEEESHPVMSKVACMHKNSGEKHLAERAVNVSYIHLFLTYK